MKLWRIISPPGWQWARTGVQWLVILMLFSMPLLARYNNYVASREIDDVMEKWQGTPQGKALAATDWTVRATGSEEEVYEGNARRNRDEIQERLAGYRGSVWSAQFGSFSATDPLAAAESAAASRSVRWVLIAGLIVPLILTLLLGRVFCSWVCPMNTLLEWTDKLRGVLKFLELRPRDYRFWRMNKYLLLGMGLMASLLFAVPILGYFYPPAIMGREIHNWVNAFFDRAENGSATIAWLAGLSLASGFILVIVLLEVFVSRRLWCRYLCPGGGLYSLLGYFRPLRVKRDVTTCTDCTECVQVCGMGLNPMRDEMGMECDNCMLCVTHCEPRALSCRFSLKDHPPQGPGLAAPQPPSLVEMVKAKDATKEHASAVRKPLTADGGAP